MLGCGRCSFFVGIRYLSEALSCCGCCHRSTGGRSRGGDLEAEDLEAEDLAQLPRAWLAPVIILGGLAGRGGAGKPAVGVRPILRTGRLRHRRDDLLFSAYPLAWCRSRRRPCSSHNRADRAPAANHERFRPAGPVRCACRNRLGLPRFVSRPALPCFGLAPRLPVSPPQPLILPPPQPQGRRRTLQRQIPVFVLTPSPHPLIVIHSKPPPSG